MAVPYDYYRIFYYVAQHKSFTRAAEVLGNNQPNITRCMNNLNRIWAVSSSSAPTAAFP